ncbi:unnamed protein product [Cyclocybe aegerita]|uniref:GST N-terminal domain-containing protein n=1 Tax=Cyclocybe aegerita TaxID=1973307 RepID=A0A8S0W8F7_CYCAE|nr:unnamed protein product [Cyclocybe aegerita]
MNAFHAIGAPSALSTQTRCYITGRDRLRKTTTTTFRCCHLRFCIDLGLEARNMTIIFYDIPSTLPDNAWSPNTWKTRYCLNYKRVPYKTEWVEYPDIELLCKKLGIAPTSKKEDGSGRDHYTLPAIHDPATGAYVSDSFAIAQYLDKTYPDTPRIFPEGTEGLQAAFDAAFMANLGELWAFALPAACVRLNPVSEEYFRRTRKAVYGKTMEEMVPKGEEAVRAWKGFEEGLGKVDAWYQKNRGKGNYLLGETLSWGDIAVAGFLIWLRIIWGEESREWKDIESWHGGRWKALIESLKEYETVN